MAESTDVFERHRRLLFSVSYDMLGSVADAEDCLQEAWLRWAREDRSDVANPRSYLVRIVTNVTLNRLRVLRNRRETYVGPWLPEPMLTAPDVADEVADADSVSYAVLVVLETLGPVERAVFVLREVFGMPHAEVAEALGRSEQSVRQLAHRAREHVHARRPRFAPDPVVRRRLTERFLGALLEGDLDGLKAMLAEGVVVLTDGGGKARAALRPVYGAERAARLLCGLGPGLADARIEHHGINGVPGVLVWTADGSLSAAATLEITGNQVTDVHIVRNPDKLRRLEPGRRDSRRGW
ncbi:RNA polymerase sigma-70 factor (ECF subfamily) [Lipingzhangella halophila]|uniref:RNA polymerase sigma-70 factor (ECF subfamily) n=1 Tax=Lipingzhangella halophila TaxID=1783352 RepID=A0A7W7W1P5_9ACTN|nr:RNA polymerase sigma-70 factor [Lipingzhangella halophila]MBB4929880.1 RNA polymerase sigma-70 factor (ECF subfamily) [Lipingzhangella halophila]